VSRIKGNQRKGEIRLPEENVRRERRIRFVHNLKNRNILKLL
jgi:hypothetical protein